MENKQKYLYLAFGIIIFIIYAVVVAIFFFGRNAEPPSPDTTPSATAAPTITAQTKPRVPYNTSAVKKLEVLLDERDRLSAADLKIRKQIIQSVGNKTAVLSQTKTYVLRYIQPVDLFQAEITTIDIAQAKEDVDSYFVGKGMTKDGLCYLPLTFYLSGQTATQLMGKGLSFSPIPEGC